MSLQEGQLLLQNVRLGYPKLFRAEAIKGMADSKPRYGAALYIPKTDLKAKALVDREIARLAQTHFKGVTPKTKDMFIQDGDGEEGDANTKGCWIVSANRAESQGMPTVIDRNRTQLGQASGKPYAGCYVNAVVSIYKPKAWNKLCASLEVVQFVKDGEPFGAARVAVDDVMPDLGDDDTEDFDV